MSTIKYIIFDYDGVFTLDDYTPVITAFQKSSKKIWEEIEAKIGEHERKHVLSVSSKQFLNDLKKEFNYHGTVNEIIGLLNQRGDTGLYKEMPKFLRWREDGNGKRGLSILSNQLAYRIPHVRRELEEKVGLEHFDRVWFSPECGYQKPFVGVTEDDKSHMDVSAVNIFPMAAHQLRGLGYGPEESIFIDDSKKNVGGWIAEGGKGSVFENLNQMKKELREKYKIDIN